MTCLSAAIFCLFAGCYSVCLGLILLLFNRSWLTFPPQPTQNSELYMEGVQEFNLSFRESSAKVKPKKNPKRWLFGDASRGLAPDHLECIRYSNNEGITLLTGTSTGTINTLTLPYRPTQKAQLKRKDSNKRTDRTCINRHIHTYRHTAGTNREHIQWDWCRQPSERRRITVHQFTKKKKNNKKKKNDQHDDFRDVFTLRFDSLHFSESRSVSVSSG